ncbi:MAG TPA: FtsX-like permease family protein, partial [Terriglobia bacterium]|nr:FtsX-like permease family protein [Terriglobia bacterium]
HRDEDHPGGERVAVLSHALWMRRFGGAANIVGRGITLDSRPYTVVGVLKPGFSFPLMGSNIDLWTPKVFELNLVTPAQVQGGAGFLQAVARLAPGVSLARANAEREVLNRRYRSENPNRPDANPANVVDVFNLQQQFVSSIHEALWVLVGVVGIVLLIACANVSSLLLSRALGRKREITIRTALGASRRTLTRQLLTESMLLAATSGAVGLAFSLGLTRVMSSLLYQTSAADPVTLVSSALLLIAISLLASYVPARRATLINPNDAMRVE